MAKTYTSFLNLEKDDYTEDQDVEVINDNLDKIDAGVVSAISTTTGRAAALAIVFGG